MTSKNMGPGKRTGPPPKERQTMEDRGTAKAQTARQKKANKVRRNRTKSTPKSGTQADGKVVDLKVASDNSGRASKEAPPPSILWDAPAGTLDEIGLAIYETQRDLLTKRGRLKPHHCPQLALAVSALRIAQISVADVISRFSKGDNSPLTTPSNILAITDPQTGKEGLVKILKANPALRECRQQMKLAAELGSPFGLDPWNDARIGAELSAVTDPDSKEAQLDAILGR